MHTALRLVEAGVTDIKLYEGRGALGGRVQTTKDADGELPLSVSNRSRLIQQGGGRRRGDKRNRFCEGVHIMSRVACNSRVHGTRTVLLPHYCTAMTRFKPLV